MQQCLCLLIPKRIQLSSFRASVAEESGGVSSISLAALFSSISRFILIYINFIFVFLGYNSSYHQNSWLTWLFRCIRTLSTIQYSWPICMELTMARLANPIQIGRSYCIYYLRYMKSAFVCRSICKIICSISVFAVFFSS